MATPPVVALDAINTFGVSVQWHGGGLPSPHSGNVTQFIVWIYSFNVNFVDDGSGGLIPIPSGTPPDGPFDHNPDHLRPTIIFVFLKEDPSSHGPIDDFPTYRIECGNTFDHFIPPQHDFGDMARATELVAYLYSHGFVGHADFDPAFDKIQVFELDP